MKKVFTHIDLDYIFEDVEAETTENGRKYKVPSVDGYVWYPSVTTVLGHDKKKFFEEWKKVPGNEKISNDAAERGNIIHDAIEKYLKNQNDYDKDLVEIRHKNIFNFMNLYLNKIDNVRALEVPLYSHTLKMAGRVDCVAEYEGSLSIIDFKGSNKIKQSKWIQNYFAQGAAYSIMWQEMTGIPIRNIVIIMGNEQGFCQVFREKVTDHVPSLFKTINRYYQMNESENNEHS